MNQIITPVNHEPIHFNSFRTVVISAKKEKHGALWRPRQAWGSPDGFS